MAVARCTNGRDSECRDFGRRISALTATTTTLAIVVPLTGRVRGRDDSLIKQTGRLCLHGRVTYSRVI